MLQPSSGYTATAGWGRCWKKLHFMYDQLERPKAQGPLGACNHLHQGPCEESSSVNSKHNTGERSHVIDWLFRFYSLLSTGVAWLCQWDTRTSLHTIYTRPADPEEARKCLSGGLFCLLCLYILLLSEGKPRGQSVT